MAEDPAGLLRMQIEKRLLRALCQSRSDANLMEIVRGPLESYRWRELSHQYIFGALTELRACDAALLRELLPSALTRKGFPDIAWGEFFMPSKLSEEEARVLVRRLLELES